MELKLVVGNSLFMKLNIHKCSRVRMAHGAVGKKGADRFCADYAEFGEEAGGVRRGAAFVGSRLEICW